MSNKNSVGRKEAKTVETAVSFTATKIRQGNLLLKISCFSQHILNNEGMSILKAIAPNILDFNSAL